METLTNAVAVPSGLWPDMLHCPYSEVMLHSTRQGSGKPLLLIHGLGSSIANWKPVIPALAAERDVIAVDLPGCGESAPLTGETTIATLTDAVEAFIRDGELS